MRAVTEKLKQRLVVIVSKVRNYQERLESFTQNRMFQNNQRLLYMELNQEVERCDDD